jgi:ACS family tartrate transporter-like MFS transporter
MTSPTDIETRTLNKIKWRFIPLLCCCYFALYLDRLNGSVAALTMNEDLGISPAVFGLIAGVFFWTYSLLEVPSNYVVSRVGVRVWVTRIIISWGLVTMLTAAAQGEMSLILLRLLLGVAEAGFAPAMIVLVGLWFPASKRAGAISLMVIAVLLSGFGTPLSAIIMTGMDGLLGLPGWRWMFLVTGMPAVVLGFVFYKVIRNRPEEATFLDADEKRWLTDRLARDDAALGGRAAHPFLRGVLNARTWWSCTSSSRSACSGSSSSCRRCCSSSGWAPSRSAGWPPCRRCSPSGRCCGGRATPTARVSGSATTRQPPRRRASAS